MDMTQENSVVFDMDGVLFDTERLCLESWVAVSNAQGIQDMAEFFPSCIGRNDTDTKALVLEHYGADFPYEAFCREASAHFHQSVEQNGLPVKKGVLEILDFLKQENWNVGLASSTSYPSVTAHLKRAGLRDFFSVIVTGDMVEHSKPQPDIYLMACDRLDRQPGQCYAIEDSPNGIRAAFLAGMKPIMVPDLVMPDAEMQEICHKIFLNLEEVRDYFAS